MRRRDALLFGLAATCGQVWSQRYRTYSRCLPDYLAGLARDAYERRNKALALIRTEDGVRDRQQWVRRTFWQLIGGEPQRTPLNTRTLGSFEREGYRVEKLVYESWPGMHVPANLYIPRERKPPFPGVLFQMGHSLNGKAAEPYQKCCQALARLGYAVLAFDPMGQGERTYYPRPGGTLTRLSSSDDEHTVPGKQMLLTGDTATRLQVWDAVRSLDVLAAHPLVDASRLASTGQSGGGTLTMFLAAVDDRLAAAAVSSGNTENFACADFNPPGSVDDAEQNFVGAGPLGFDRWDTLYPMAPKPLLIAVSARDFFGTYSPSYIANGVEEFEKLRRIYSILGAEDRVQWLESPVPHALAPNIRVAIYNFFERWLRGSAERVEEPLVRPEPEKQLWSGSTGNVVRDLGSTTPAGLARKGYRPVRSAAPDLAALLQLEPMRDVNAVCLGRANWAGVIVEALEVQSAPGVYLPVWLYLPQRPQAVLLVLEPRGRNAAWREDDLYHRVALGGAVVCAFDIRGIGDLSPEVGRGNPYYTRPHSEEDAYAWASMMLGRPLLGQRVADILVMADAMRRYPATRGQRVVLAAKDAMTVPGLFAAALDPKIERVYLADGVDSYASLLAADEYQEPFANFIPGILKSTDLPRIAKQLGARLTRGESWDDRALAAVYSN
jgi:dienelactone hydrolase